MRFLHFSLQQVASRIRSGHLSPIELCELCLERIEKIRPLNAFITVTKDGARQQAKDSEQRIRNGETLGPLDGVPFAVKDNYCTKGVLTSCASKMLSSYVPPFTATVIQKLLDRGAILIGKTNMDEFAMGCGSVDSFYGPVKNPWKSQDFHIAGGSSGGSAVSVASGAAFGALASDTGGSTRNPAALCGVVGFKPTYGLLSRHGLIPLVNSMDVPGIHARCVDDTAFLLDAMIGYDHLDSTSVSDQVGSLNFPDELSVAGLHIGIPDEYNFVTIDREVIAAWQKVADHFSNAGAKVTRVSLPHTQYSIACYSVLNSCEVASNFARYDGIEYGHRVDTEESTESLYAASRQEGFNAVVRGRILAGNYFLLRRNYDKYFLHALKVRRLISDDIDKVFRSGIQFLLTPVTIGAAPLYKDFIKKDGREQTALQDLCTQPANMAGIPAVTLPVCLSSNSLPIGLQLLGPQFSDSELLLAAKWIEKTVNFQSKISEQLSL